MNSLLYFVISLLLSSHYIQTRDCNDFPFKRLLKESAQARQEYRGLYRNQAYQYSVVIPKGLTAYDGRDEPNHQGFGLVLGDSLQSFIFVRGENNSFDYGTAHEAAKKNAEYLRQDGNKIESETISESHLAMLNAVHVVVVYTCPRSSDRHVQSSLMALSPDKSLLYTVELYSPAHQYNQDQAVLARIAKSWKPVPEVRQQRRKR